MKCNGCFGCGELRNRARRCMIAAASPSRRRVISPASIERGASFERVAIGETTSRRSSSAEGYPCANTGRFESGAVLFLKGRKILVVLSDDPALSSSYTQESGKAGVNRPSLSRPRRLQRHGCEELAYLGTRAPPKSIGGVDAPHQSRIRHMKIHNAGPRPTQYTMIPNDVLRSGALSDGAIAVLAELMSHADGRCVSVRQLIKPSRSRHLVDKALHELEDHRLLTRVQARNSGQFAKVEARVSWTPLTDDEIAEWSSSISPHSNLSNTVSSHTTSEQTKKTKNPVEDQLQEDLLTERVVEDSISVDARAPSNGSQSVSPERLWVDLDEKRAERAEIVAVVDAPVEAKAAMSASLPKRVEPQEAQVGLAVVNTKPEPEEIAVVKTRPDDVAPDDHGRGEVPASERIEKIDAFLAAWRDEFRDGPSSARSLFVLPNAWQERLLWVWSHWTRDEIGVAFAATKKRVPDAPWAYFRACLESIARGEWGEKRQQTPNDAKRERRAKLELLAKLAPRWEIKPWLFDTVPIDDVIAYARSMPDAQNEPLSVKDLEQRIPGLAEKLPGMPQGLLSERFWRDRRFLDCDGGES